MAQNIENIMLTSAFLSTAVTLTLSYWIIFIILWIILLFFELLEFLTVFDIVTSAKVMFLPQLVGLSVSRISLKVLDEFLEGLLQQHYIRMLDWSESRSESRILLLIFGIARVSIRYAVKLTAAEKLVLVGSHYGNPDTYNR